MKTRGVLKLTGKLCGSVVFGLVLLEIGLRLTGLCPSPPLLLTELERLPIDALIAREAEESWIHEPSSETILKRAGNRPDIVAKRNWCSCRENDETPLEKPEGVYRILVEGDSHTDGFVENDDSYANILERTLGDQVDVMNAGQAVSSPYQQLWVYRTLYRRFHPDLLIVGFYAGNDIFELMLQDDRIHLERSGRDYVHAGPTWRPDLAREQSPWMAMLHRHFAICRAATQLNWLRLERQRKRDLGAYYTPLIEAQKIYPGAVWQGLNQAYYFKHHPEDWTEASRMLRFVFNEFKKDAPPDGMMIVIIPSCRQLNPSVSASAAEMLQLSGEDCACDQRACDVAAAICRQLDIPVLDMQPAMKHFVGDLYWSCDHHINIAAHRLIAQGLAARVRQLVDAANGRTSESRTEHAWEERQGVRREQPQDGGESSLQ